MTELFIEIKFLLQKKKKKKEGETQREDGYEISNLGMKEEVEMWECESQDLGQCHKRGEENRSQGCLMHNNPNLIQAKN